MTGMVDARIQELGITLPATPRPAANYVPCVHTGALIFVSGQVAIGADGTKYLGAVGRDLSIEDGQKAARLCAINVLAALKEALRGDLDRVRRTVKITGFVQAPPDFTRHPEVVNGASDLFVTVFGEAGKHSRAAVGVFSLPSNVAVEIDAIFEVS